MNENLIVLYTTEFLLLLAPTKSCLIIVVILYRYNDLSSICNQNTFDEENFDFQIDTASHKAYPLHNLSTKISDILMVSVADFVLCFILKMIQFSIKNSLSPKRVTGFDISTL